MTWLVSVNKPYAYSECACVKLPDNFVTGKRSTGADPGFLDRGFKLAEGGGGVDLTNFS